jgi:hypothetical protein
MRVSEFFGFGDFLLSAKMARQTPVFACPSEENARQVVEANFRVPIHLGLEGLLFHEIPRTDLVCLKTTKDAARASETIIRLFPRAIILEKRKADNSEDVVRRFLEAGYEKNEETYSATEFGLPQDAKRTFVVLTRKNPAAFSARFPFPDATSKAEPTFAQIMDKDADASLLPQKLPKDCKIILPEGLMPAFHHDSYIPKILVNQGPSPRKLSINEVRRAFGIPDDFGMPIPVPKAYGLVAHSTWVPACAEIMKSLSEWLA